MAIRWAMLLLKIKTIKKLIIKSMILFKNKQMSGKNKPKSRKTEVYTKILHGIFTFLYISVITNFLKQYSEKDSYT